MKKTEYCNPFVSYEKNPLLKMVRISPKLDPKLASVKFDSRDYQLRERYRSSYSESPFVNNFCEINDCSESGKSPVELSHEYCECVPMLFSGVNLITQTLDNSSTID